jgi:hypothetical protein
MTYDQGSFESFYEKKPVNIKNAQCALYKKYKVYIDLFFVNLINYFNL